MTDPDPRTHLPRQLARTRRFTLGHPRALWIAPDASRVVFLRALAGDDPIHGLWTVSLEDGSERLVVNPAALDLGADDVPEAERSRRERARETGSGVVAYATDEAVTMAVTAVGGQAVVADLVGGAARVLSLPGPVVDPRPDPSGQRLAWVRDGALWSAQVDGTAPREVAAEEDPELTWGLAEFVAAEEMGRTRGFWWSPDGSRLAVARSDTSHVARWHVADPTEPSHHPHVLRYPAAGGTNANVTLWTCEVKGRRTEVVWDRVAFPYLCAVRWTRAGLLVVVQSRDQRRLQALDADPVTGATTVAWEQQDQAWVELVPGLPRRLDDGRLLHSVERDDTRGLGVEGSLLTPPGLHVRRFVGVAEESAWLTASADDPTSVAVWKVALDGSGPCERVTEAAGVHDAAVGGTVRVLVSRDLDHPDVRVTCHGPDGALAIRSVAEQPVLTPTPIPLRLGSRDLHAMLLLPAGTDPVPGEPLPVLLSPYGGPHAQRVLQACGSFVVEQWFAEHGFAVLVADGRGTPGRGLRWERAVAGDLASAPLQDQVDALDAAADARPGLLDLDRVAIRGWSFGGFLAALAVLRRPDRFHAAVAGAPVVDWRLYDTHYTERYLGLPDEHPERYRRSSLIDDAPALRRPLLLLHGLADDNVVAAHTLRLSAALVAAGQSHNVIPLPGVTHMATRETVASNLLHLELRFLVEALRSGREATALAER